MTNNYRDFGESSVVDNQRKLSQFDNITEELILTAIDNIYDSVILINTDGIIQFMSKNYEDRFMTSRKKAIGQHITTLIPDARLPRVLETGKAEIDFAAKINGRFRIISRIPLKRKGQVIGALGKVMFWKREKILDFYNYWKVSQPKAERHSLYDFSSYDIELADIIGKSAEIKRSKSVAALAAQNDCSVLIEGESGTGKELFAKAIHRISRRRENAFVCVNCASIPHELFESELFGYKPGAFTGASMKGKIGKFEAAHKGTIFLDEIGDLDLSIQSKLLRTLQEKEIEKIGTRHPIKIDFRVICATNQKIKQQVQKGLFRLDLYHRINEFEIELPPLRTIKEDIPLLVDYFMNILREEARNKRNVISVSKDVSCMLQNYDWKGNIRELKNVIQRAFVFCMGSQIEIEDLPPNFIKTVSDSVSNKFSSKKPILSLKCVTELAEKQAIIDTLRLTGNNKVKAARLLDIHRTSLYQKLKKYGLDKPEPTRN
ncbi:MAG: sigma 54-interacting transcriptional regulator [Thermodesulfobacteriota bacterium]|nr:sigma 54-interacting transcriptional regulator [Thermodesulfobacteriota bacterium]